MGEKGMDEVRVDQNLNHISTVWTLVRAATPVAGAANSASTTDAARRALKALMERYSGAVYRYLLGALRDPHAADDLSQEFSLRFVRGDFRNADPERGRFRDLVKTVLFHLIVDYQRRQKASPLSLPPDDCGPAQPSGTAPPLAESGVLHAYFTPVTPPSPEACGPAQPGTDGLTSDTQFIESWRQQLLSQAWAALARWDRRNASRYYDVLRYRAEHRELSSAEMADQLSVRLNKKVSADWVRKTMQRAREQFADLLLDELSHSIVNPTRDRLAEELADLRLLSYCQPALERWNWQ
jgi:RNA polymerase sigma factor (sigma-70 family)